MNGTWQRLTANAYRETLAVAGLFLLVALAATWPIPTAPGELSVSGPANSDIFLNQYLIFWGAHALTTNPGNLYHTNMFHPSPYTFAYADMLLTDSLLLLPVIALTNNPALAYNILLWLSVIIGGSGMYVLVRQLELTRIPALVAALLFVLNPAHFVRYRQPQFFNDGFLPWFLAALLMWLAACGLRGDRSRRHQGSLRYAALAAALFCLHAQTGSHNAIFGLIAGGSLLLYHAFPLVARRTGRPGARPFVTGAALMTLIGIVILVPLFYPYYAVSQFLEGARITDEALRGGSAEPIDLFSADSGFYRWLDTAWGWPSQYLTTGDGPRRHAFPGFVMLLLGALALLPPWPDRHARRTIAAWSLDLILGLAAVAALANVAAGMRRLSPLTAAYPSVWVLAGVAVVAAAARLQWFAGEDFLWSGVARQIRAHREKAFWLGMIILLVGAALGPAMGVYELIRVIPGANLIRVPSRFLLPATMAVSVLAAWGAARLLRRGRAGSLILASLVVVFLVESTFVPIPLVAYPYPRDPIAAWLGEQPGEFAIFEIPASGIRTDPTRQMLQSVYHWKKLLVGYSGAFPPGYFDRIERLRRGFPEDVALDELATLGVRYVVVRDERLEPDEQQAIETQPRLRRVETFDTGSVWALDPTDRP